MGTTLRTELSKNNKYYISKHRRLELTHFCRQCPEWRIAISYMNYFGQLSNEEIKAKNISKPTEYTAERLAEYQRRIDMVRNSATKADEYIKDYIYIAVTQGRSYDWLLTNRDIPCSKNYFYDRLKKFYYELDKIRE